MKYIGDLGLVLNPEMGKKAAKMLKSAAGVAIKR